jgi:predicted site-specific integrase-resolvase
VASPPSPPPDGSSNHKATASPAADRRAPAGAGRPLDAIKERARSHAYLRVSSKAQDHATQREAVEPTAQARGDKIASEGWYADKISGKTLARPELDRLRADARAGKIRRLYVYRLDRLTRSEIRDTLEVVEELRAAGVDFVNIADSFDLNGPATEIIPAVMASAAKMDRRRSPTPGSRGASLVAAPAARPEDARRHPRAGQGRRVDPGHRAAGATTRTHARRSPSPVPVR